MSAFSNNQPEQQLHVGDDIPGDEIPEGRPRLKLKKRGAPKAKASASSGASSSIFGHEKDDV